MNAAAALNFPACYFTGQMCTTHLLNYKTSIGEKKILRLWLCSSEAQSSPRGLFTISNSMGEETFS